MADSSELGWRLVQEYITNPLAGDSEDDTKILRAQICAERNLKPRKRKRNVLHHITDPQQKLQVPVETTLVENRQSDLVYVTTVSSLVTGNLNVQRRNESQVLIY